MGGVCLHVSSLTGVRLDKHETAVIGVKQGGVCLHVSSLTGVRLDKHETLSKQGGVCLQVSTGSGSDKPGEEGSSCGYTGVVW